MAQQTKKRKIKLTKTHIILLSSILVVAVAVSSFFIYLYFSQSYTLVHLNQDDVQTEVKEYHNFQKAYDEMINFPASEDSNPAIIKDGKIVAIKYGVVNFHTKTCEEITRYEVDNRRYGYTNGCYGADGAYISSSNKGDTIEFMQSGVRGFVSIDDITIENYYSNKLNTLNHFSVQEGSLVHLGTTDIFEAPYAIKASLGEGPSWFKESFYYSYDAHYFYNKYETMINDYRNNSHELAVNANEPYYAYFVYLSHRVPTSYSGQDINQYIDSLGYISAEESLLKDQGPSFSYYEREYGVNAISMFAVSINESAFGTSSLTYETNNIFGHSAFDANPSSNTSKYTNVAESIAYHAKDYMSLGYLNYCDGSQKTCLNENNRYFGSYFGDKESGLNVRYASDPYWGEKAAHYYYAFDQSFENKDYNKYKLVLANDIINIKAEPSTSSSTLAETLDVNHMVFTVLEEIEGEEVNGSTLWYKIQVDADTTKEEGRYIHEHHIGYIPASSVTSLS